MSAAHAASPTPAPMSGASANADDIQLIASYFATATPDGKPAFGTMRKTTWGAFAASLRERREGEKNGANIVAARLKPEPNGSVRRLKMNVIARTAIILDCETHKKTGEVPPDIAEVVKRIKVQGWAAVVYSSHNHSVAAPRYRIVLPPTTELAAELPAVEVIADRLKLVGVLDCSKLCASSVFFLPSAAPGRLAEHETVIIDGAAIDAEWMRERAGALQATRDEELARLHAAALVEAEKRHADRLAAGLGPAENLIERIRDHLDLEAELLRHDYIKVGGKFLYPKSETGIPGVCILQGRDGVQRVYSHHSDDPLSAGNLPTWCQGVKAIDVVDVVTILDHDGDRKRALRQLSAQFGIKTKPTTKQDEPPPHPGYDGPHDSAGRGTIDTRGSSNAAAAPNLAAIIAAAQAETVERFNAKYMVVNDNGKALIFQECLDETLNRRHYIRLLPRDLDILYANDLVPFSLNEQGRTVYKPSSVVWIRAPERRQYIDGITFDPSTTRPKPGVLNLWRGFAVEPKLGDWSLLRDHILNVICGGNAGHFRYLMGWIARMVQYPNKPGEVAVVLKGGEGTGKGTLARALLRIVGQHGIAISNAKHLIGNFNGHLRDAVFLFADEAYFAGDRAHVGVLKSIITEPHLTIEAKFQNAEQMPNYLHVMMASNEEWVVPAATDARRFFVLEVDGSNANNHEYFAAISEQMDAGGYEAMLHDLLAYDLTCFNVRAVPRTSALQHQRKLSLPTSEAWWQDCLSRGYVFRSRLGLEAEFGQWRDVISMELLCFSYIEFAKARHERRPMSREDLGKFMQRMGCRPARPSGKGIVGEHMTDEPNAFGNTHRVARAVHSDRPRSYLLGSIANARASFSEALGGIDVEWEPDAAFLDAAE